MQQLLVYSDSLTWGIIPDTRNRLPFDKRWPGVVEMELNQQGKAARVVENCLNGRRTVWDDPFKAGRDGSAGLAQAIEINSPLALVILMLGTNDFQCTHDNSAWLSAQGVATLIQVVRAAPVEPGMPVPEILIIAPPAITKPKGVIANKFQGAVERSRGFASELSKVAEATQVHFLDANDFVTASAVDGIHLDEPMHSVLGQAIANQIAQLNLV